MRHLKKGRKLNRTSSHRKALMRTLATSLFEHKRISTTEAKAKELRPYAEQLITKAKKALVREKQGLLPDGQTIDIHNRRLVYKNIKNKAVIQELFDTIAPLVEERSGGYTRIIKTGTRRGDGGKTAIIELVDWSAPKDGADSFKSKKRAKPRRERKVKEKKEDVVKEVDEEVLEATEVEATEVEAIVDEAPVEEEQIKSEETPEETVAEEEKTEKIKSEVEVSAEKIPPESEGTPAEEEIKSEKDTVKDKAPADENKKEDEKNAREVEDKEEEKKSE